jgi:hypothetical protein
MADLSDDSTAPATRAHNPRPHNRRLFGKVLIAFYKACDDGDFEVATILLDVLHRLVSSSDASRPADRRRSEYALIVASKMLNKLADDGWPPKVPWNLQSDGSSGGCPQRRTRGERS